MSPKQPALILFAVAPNVLTLFESFMTHLRPRHSRALTTEISPPSDSLLAFIPAFARPLIDTSHVNGLSYKYWPLSLPVMANLYWLGRTLFLDHIDISASYLFNKKIVLDR